VGDARFAMKGKRLCARGRLFQKYQVLFKSQNFGVRPKSWRGPREGIDVQQTHVTTKAKKNKTMRFTKEDSQKVAELRVLPGASSNAL
jgi:hypothetical protein